MPVKQISVISQGDQVMSDTQTDTVQLPQVGLGQQGQTNAGFELQDPDVPVPPDTQGVGETDTNKLDHIPHTMDTVTKQDSCEVDMPEPCDNTGINDRLGKQTEGIETHVVANAVIVGETNSDISESEIPSDVSLDKHTDTQTCDIAMSDGTVMTTMSRDAHTEGVPINGTATVTAGNQPTDKRTTRSSTKNGKKEKPTPFKKKDSVAKETLHSNSPTPISTERCDSSLSNTSIDLCRICQCDSCEILNDSPLVAPCVCSGSLKFIHQACLQKWIKSSDKLSCELCMFEYKMTKKTKPFREWEKLDMTPAERRKVVCSVTFHVIAITCVVWSLYVLIDRTTEEVEAGSLLWPFWTKLIVVAIGFTGGVVFMYVQCKMYLMLCKKWRMYNKIILISSISDGQRATANREGLARIKAKQAAIEGNHVANLDVFNIITETESV